METKVKNINIDIVVEKPPSNGGNGFNGGGGRWIQHRYSHYSLPLNPSRFALWLFIAASIMFFAALTSAYIVRQGAGDWMRVQLPTIMWFNTIVLLISSVTIQWGYNSLKKRNIRKLRIGLFLTLILGGGFLIGQIYAWNALAEMGVYLQTNPSSSFLYVLTGAHGFHILIGIFFLFYVTVRTLKGYYNSENRLGVELCTTYWHFLDVVWVYLFIFLLVLQP